MLDFNGNEPKEIRYDDGIRLPDGYTRLEYIESTGTQYIDTGYMINENFKYKLKVAITDTRTASYVYPQIMGAYGLGNASDKKNYTVSYTPSTKKLAKFVNYNINDIYTVEFKVGETIVNDTIYENDKTWEGVPYGNVYIFTAITSNTGIPDTFYSRAKIYYSQIYDNDTLVRNFIPAKRNSDNEIGLYDIVNNVFYTNQGTGLFVEGNEYKGHNVAKVVCNNTVVWKGLPSTYTRLEYIESTGTQYIDTGFVATDKTSFLIDSILNNGVLIWASNNGYKIGIMSTNNVEYITADRLTTSISAEPKTITRIERIYDYLTKTYTWGNMTITRLGYNSNQETYPLYLLARKRSNLY